MRFSYSQYNGFSKCSRWWKNNYVLKLEGKAIGASLIFGSAIDAAVMELLDHKTGWKDTFHYKMSHPAINGKSISPTDDEVVTYAHADFDEYILTDKDLLIMKDWVQELDLGHISIDPVECYKKCAKIKKNPYLRTTTQVLTYFNRCSWLSLCEKGEILLDAFHTQFYPRITKVISTQRRVSIKADNSEDSINGVVDMVVNLKEYGEAPVILDLKTSSFLYDKEQLEISDQLTLYAALMQEEIPLPSHVGYVVLCKNIPKDVVSTCSLCNHSKTGKHRTCDNVANGVRCSGEWLEKRVPKVEVQVMIEQKTQQKVNELLNDFSNVIIMAKNDLTFKNTDACNNFYGGKCVYYDLCHNNSSEGLTKRGKAE